MNQPHARDRAVTRIVAIVHQLAPQLGEESRDTFKLEAEAIVDELIAACAPGQSEHAEPGLVERATNDGSIGTGRDRNAINEVEQTRPGGSER